jgi:hypothetical protein
MIFRVELVSAPVADVDRAKASAWSGWASRRAGPQVDAEHRFVELLPPGSPCSIARNTGNVDGKPGSVHFRSTLTMLTAPVHT